MGTVVVHTLDELHALAVGATDVVVVAPHGALVLGPDEEVAATLSYFGAEAVFAAGDVLAGLATASAWGRLLAGESIDGVVDTEGEVLAWIADAERDLVGIGGRMVPAASGHPAVVAFVDPQWCPPALPPAVDAALWSSVSGYAGAPARQDRIDIVAAEIVATPLWSGTFCADVVKLVEQFGLWGQDPDDPVPGEEVSLLTISPRLFAWLEADVGERIVPRLRSHWPEFAWNGLQDAFVLRYRAHGEGPRALALHHDVAQISAAVRLNDGYGGGEVQFPRQSYDNGRAPVGTLVAWPSLVTHPHRAAPVLRGTKYSLTIWWKLPV